MIYNSNTSINSGNAIHFGNNTSSNQQFPQQSGYQHQQVPSIQNNYHNSQQHPQLQWTEQQQNNYQQPTNNNNGFNSNNVTKGTDINNSNAFRGSHSNTGNSVIPQSNLSQQAGTTFSTPATPPTNQVGQQQNDTTTIANASWVPVQPQQNIGPAWQQNVGANWQQTHEQNQLQIQTQPQQSSLQRTFDYVQQCQTWNS